MNYEFPKIEHINDVIPHIKNYSEFIISDKNDYKAINYVVSKQETFSSADIKNDIGAQIRRECRGLIFDKNGKIVRRSYQKFFNINEKDETQSNKIDLTQNHIILEKLDGSMITPIYINDGFRFTTKMGITDTSINSEKWVLTKSNYIDFVNQVYFRNFTPIFEWCSRSNRIVIDYPEDRLVLTGIRNTLTGKYTSYG